MGGLACAAVTSTSNELSHRLDAWRRTTISSKLFLTRLPGYLSTSLHLDVLHSGFFTAVSRLPATVSSLVVGACVVDYLIRRGRRVYL
jgi:hypothetical protein